MRNSKENIIDYVLENTKQSEWKNIKNQRIKRACGLYSLKSREDNKLKHCKECGLVWQKLKKRDVKPWTSYPRGVIPTYGKEKIICPKCNK